ncbi:MAG: hypothetical protein VW729_17680, partial [Deltaproteobacteria bacterium]
KLNGVSKREVSLVDFMSSIMRRIKLAERDFASGVMRCIGMWCDAKLDDQSQSFTVGPTLQVLW